MATAAAEYSPPHAENSGNAKVETDDGRDILGAAALPSPSLSKSREGSAKFGRATAGISQTAAGIAAGISNSAVQTAKAAAQSAAQTAQAAVHTAEHTAAQAAHSAAQTAQAAVHTAEHTAAQAAHTAANTAQAAVHTASAGLAAARHHPDTRRSGKETKKTDTRRTKKEKTGGRSAKLQKQMQASVVQSMKVRMLKSSRLRHLNKQKQHLARALAVVCVVSLALMCFTVELRLRDSSGGVVNGLKCAQLVIQCVLLGLQWRYHRVDLESERATNFMRRWFEKFYPIFEVRMIVPPSHTARASATPMLFTYRSPLFISSCLPFRRLSTAPRARALTAAPSPRHPPPRPYA
jgi:hypothetical protein